MLKVTGFTHPLSRGTGAVGLCFIVGLGTFSSVCTLASELLVTQFCLFYPVPPIPSVSMFWRWQEIVLVSKPRLDFLLCLNLISNEMVVN